MNEQKLKTVQQWRTALQEAARTAVEALAFETPINKAVPSLDERSEILGAAIHKIRELVRPEPKTVAFLEEEAWYRMKREAKPSGEYRTPKEAIDFVTANPPLDIPPAADPIQPGAPKMVPGDKPFTRLSLVNIPELNIEFHNFYTDDFYKAVCYWENKEGERRVYEITVKPWALTGTGPGKWRALAQVCAKTIFALEGNSKSLVIECALVAMRRYLIRAHRCAWRTARRLAKQQAYNSKAAEPLSPEEELADTIKRQKEEVQA